MVAQPHADTEANSATLDARGLACPLPVLKAKRAIRKLDDDKILVVLATDPGSVEDFKAFCEVTGHRLESHSESDGVYTFAIRKMR